MDLIYLKPKNIFNLKDVKFSVSGSHYTGRCSLMISNKQIFYIDFEKGNFEKYKLVRKHLYRVKNNLLKSAELLSSFGFDYTLNLENYK